MSAASQQRIYSYVGVSMANAEVAVRAPSRLRTHTSRRTNYGLFFRRLLPRRVSWNSEQHQEVPLDTGSSCSHGSSMHAHQLLHRLAAAQREHGCPRGQVQPTRLHQRARAAIAILSRGTSAPRRTRTGPFSERTASRTQSSPSLARFGV